MTTATRIRWERFAADFWRSKRGRYDVFRAANTGRWVAWDFEAGVCRRFGTLEAAQAWCEERA